MNQATTKQPKPLFLKSALSLLGVGTLSIFLLLRANKEKSSFEKLTGVVTSLQSTHPAISSEHSDKRRYLQLDNYYKPFEIFVGNSAGDFKPKFQVIDQLKAGDTVTVYFDERFQNNEPVNRLAYFIDKGPTPIFIKGGWEQYLAFFLLGLAAVIFILLLVLKKKGKIV